MSPPSRAERRRQQKAERREAQRQLRQQQKADGLTPFPTTTTANAKSDWTTVAEEKKARQEAVEEQLRVYRNVLPVLLKRFGKILDPRSEERRVGKECRL